MMKYIDMPHIGEVLHEEFLEPLGLSQNALALAIGVKANRINDIVNGKRGITADTDLRLAKYFGLSDGYFLRIQERFALLKAKREIEKELNNIVKFEYANDNSEELM